MGANAGGRNKLLLPELLGGSTSLMVQPGSETGWLKVQLSTSGSGWLGFGVADAGAPLVRSASGARLSARNGRSFVFSCRRCNTKTPCCCHALIIVTQGQIHP
jgi:hypothetical protein